MDIRPNKQLSDQNSNFLTPTSSINPLTSKKIVKKVIQRYTKMYCMLFSDRAGKNTLPAKTV